MTTRKKGATAIELDNELKAMPEHAVVAEINGFSRSLELFNGNYRQLRDVLAYYEDPRKSLHLNQIGHEKENLKFRAEVMRLMHNYVAAAFSLVDHSRKHYRKLYKAGEFPEYLERVKHEFADDLLANFVKGLRNHFQHYGLPSLEFQTSWRRGAPDFKRTINLKKDDLQDFDWDSKAKKFLDAQGDDINLVELVEIYQEKVSTFYEWFQSRQAELHAIEFKKVAKKEAEIRRIVLPDIINASLQFPGVNVDSFEASVLRFLEYEEQVLFALMEPSSKAEFLVVILRKITDISAQLEQRIKTFYEVANQQAAQ